MRAGNLKYAVLGLVASRPDGVHGYKLKADFDALSDDFWQVNAFVGYRFPRRRAEIRLGLLNIADQDYRLNPLNLTAELPRERTLLASFRFSF